MSIEADIKALEEALALGHGDLACACSPDRIRRLMDALKDRGATQAFAADQESRAIAAEARLSKAIDLLTYARDSVAAEVEQNRNSWGDRLMHKQRPVIEQLAAIDAFLEEVSE